ncbi:MAG: hypothetical protein IVW55_15700 [Chloroflexi bacterium]|nr:hypothetical protein [Chloroflexota bacterium]
MDNQQEGQGKKGGDSYQGYDAPGKDTIVQSSSDAVPSPTETSEQRLTTPKPSIQSINETPGDANPALSETISEEKGQTSTADMLRAREAAEEEYLRRADAQVYADQPPDGGRPQEWEEKDSGRPNWPNDRLNEAVESKEITGVEEDFIGMTQGGSLSLAGRADRAEDSAADQASAGESRSGLSSVGHDIEEDIYERQEMHRPVEESEMDRLAPGMLNLPPEDDR